MSRGSRLRRIAKSKRLHKPNGTTLGKYVRGYTNYVEMLLHKGERGKTRGAFGCGKKGDVDA